MPASTATTKSPPNLAVAAAQKKQKMCGVPAKVIVGRRSNSDLTTAPTLAGKTIQQTGPFFGQSPSAKVPTSTLRLTHAPSRPPSHLLRPRLNSRSL